jgi:hypothetical protein
LGFFGRKCARKQEHFHAGSNRGHKRGGLN